MQVAGRSLSLLWCRRGCSGSFMYLVVERVLLSHYSDKERDLGGEWQRQSPDDSLEVFWQEVCTVFPYLLLRS